MKRIALALALLVLPALSHAGLVDVSETPYFADKTGATDATAAINMAVAASGGTYMVPEGTYSVKDLVFTEGGMFLSPTFKDYTGASFILKFKGDAFKTGAVVGGFAVMPQADGVTAVIVAGRGWVFPKVYIEGKGRTHGQTGLKITNDGATPATNNVFNSIILFGLDTALLWSVDAGSYGSNNVFNHLYACGAKSAIKYAYNGGGQGYFKNLYHRAYLESADVGVEFYSSTFTNLAPAWDTFNLNFDGVGVSYKVNNCSPRAWVMDSSMATPPTSLSNNGNTVSIKTHHPWD